MLQNQLLRGNAFFLRGGLQGIGKAAIEQKVGLRGVAQHFHARILCGKGNAGEVDMGSNVFVTNIQERVAVGLVRLVAHHGAGDALLVVILGFWKTVIQQKHRATLQTIRQCADKRLALLVNFGQIVVLATYFERGS